MGENRTKSPNQSKCKKRRKRKNSLKFLIMAICAIIIINIWNDSDIKKIILDRIGEKFETTQVELEEDKDIRKPVEREEAEVIECLAQMANEDERFKEIYQNKESYPEEMLASLANNPEMIEFVSNFNKDRKKATAKLTRQEKGEAS